MSPIGRADDLFAAINVRDISDILFSLEVRIDALFEARHEYPL
jgi:hypothetical protein